MLSSFDRLFDLLHQCGIRHCFCRSKVWKSACRSDHLAILLNNVSMFQQMRRGRRFYISRVKAVGPDGSTRTLPQSLEVIVN